MSQLVFCSVVMLNILIFYGGLVMFYFCLAARLLLNWPGISYGRSCLILEHVGYLLQWFFYLVGVRRTNQIQMFINEAKYIMLDARYIWIRKRCNLLLNKCFTLFPYLNAKYVAFPICIHFIWCKVGENFLPSFNCYLVRVKIPSLTSNNFFVC